VHTLIALICCVLVLQDLANKPQLKELLPNMNTYTASPEAVKKLDAGLKDLRFVPRGEVTSNLRETLQAIEDSLQHARVGGNYSRLLFNLGKAAQAHPALLKSLRLSACWQQIEVLLNAVATDKRVYTIHFQCLRSQVHK
jgi:hypothetical protein